jgi:hypothetical protein
VKAPLLLAAALVLAGCGGRHDASNDRMNQTGFPGMVTAGGHTSGEVMAANTPNGAVNRGPAGTPGIPGGAEGNTGGAGLASSVPKTTDIAANTTAPAGAGAPQTSASAAPTPNSQIAATAANSAASAPGVNNSAPPAAPASASVAAGAAPAASAPLSAASAAALQARQAQQELEQVQDIVAARWKARAAGGAFANAQARPSTPVQVVVRSEKLGTAPPSPDTKTLTKAEPKHDIVRKAPDAAGPNP